jgi:hypothetical protein
VRVLVVGHERSGTSWLGRVLEQTAGAGYVVEPDTPSISPYAIRARSLGTLPVLAATEPGPAAFRRLWDCAFGAPVRFVPGQGRLSMSLVGSVSSDHVPLYPSPDAPIRLRLRLAAITAVPRHVGWPVAHHVVKSVRAPFILDWLRAGWDPVVVVCFRHPLDVVASFVEMWMARRTGQELLAELTNEARQQARERFAVPEPTGTNPVAYVAWRAGVVMSMFEEACRDHPELHVFEHGLVCADPLGQLHELVDAVGLEWRPEVEEYIARSNQPGTRYQLTRVALEQQDRWRERLSRDDAKLAADVLSRFPISGRYAHLGG